MIKQCKIVISVPEQLNNTEITFCTISSNNTVQKLKLSG